jgi:branched-chain amino acid transport system substrate-binding protein
MLRTRVAFQALAGAVLATGLMALPASAETVVKVGVINTYSGPQASQGKPLQQGIDLYYKLHQKDLPPGVKIELIKRDDTGLRPEVAKRLAQELVTRDHVQLLAGVVWSPNAMAIAPVSTQAKVPLVDMNAASKKVPQLTHYMIRTSFTLTQQAYPLGKWAAKKGYKNAFTAVTDYAPGLEGAEAFAKAFKEAGGVIVGTVTFPPPPTVPDYAPFLQRVKDAHPDVLYIFVPAGASVAGLMKAAKDVGIQAAGIHIISTEDLVPEEQLAAIGDQAVGLITSGVYSAWGDRPANKEFVDAWHKEYGAKSYPDFESADAWEGMKAIFQLVEKTKGKFTGEQAIDFLGHWQDADSVKGPIMIDPKTHDIIQNVYMRKIEKRNGELVDIEFETIPMVNAQGIATGLKVSSHGAMKSMK